MNHIYTPAELRKMVADATPGPWGWDDLKLYGFAGEQIIDYAAYEGMWFASYGQPEKEAANAHLMAQSPTIALAFADALEEVARLREACLPLSQMHIMDDGAPDDAVCVISAKTIKAIRAALTRKGDAE